MWRNAVRKTDHANENIWRKAAHFIFDVFFQDLLQNILPIINQLSADQIQKKIGCLKILNLILKMNKLPILILLIRYIPIFLFSYVKLHFSVSLSSLFLVFWYKIHSHLKLFWHLKITDITSNLLEGDFTIQTFRNERF
jgi:hypothetical protein